MARTSFVDTLKANAGALTAVMAFFGAIASFVTPFGAGVSIAALIAASTAIVSYNIWRWSRARPAPPVALREPRAARTRRLVLHAASAVALVAAWSAAVILHDPATIIDLRYAMFGCPGIQPGLDTYLAGDGKSRFHFRNMQIECTDEPQKAVLLTRKLIDDPAVWRAEPEPQRSHALGMLHFELLSSPYLSEGEAAVAAREAARYLSGNPAMPPLLAFATAIGPQDDAKHDDIIRLLDQAAREEAAYPEPEQSRFKAHRLYWGGRALERAGFAVEAEQRFREGIADAPTPTEADRFLLRLGINLYLQDRAEAAVETWRRMTRPDALQFSLQASDATDRYQRALLDGNKHEAETLREQADALAAFAMQAPGSSEPNVRFALAMVHRQLGRYAEALSDFQRLTEQYPANPDYHFMAGLAAFDARQLSVARKAFERRLELKPRDAEASFWLGRTFYQLEDRESAGRFLRQAERFDPSLPGPLLWLAIIFEGQEEQPGTTSDRIAAGEMALSYATRAQTLATAKNDGATLATLAKLRPELLNNLAYHYAEAEDRAQLDLASNYAHQALDIRPDDPYAMDTVAYIALRQVQLGLAGPDSLEGPATLLATVLASLPAQDIKSRADVLAHAGLLAALRHDPEAARRRYHEALGLDPGNVAALKALRDLPPPISKPDAAAPRPPAPDR